MELDLEKNYDPNQFFHIEIMGSNQFNFFFRKILLLLFMSTALVTHHDEEKRN